MEQNRPTVKLWDIDQAWTPRWWDELFCSGSGFKPTWGEQLSVHPRAGQTSPHTGTPGTESAVEDSGCGCVETTTAPVQNKTNLLRQVQSFDSENEDSCFGTLHLRCVRFLLRISFYIEQSEQCIAVLRTPRLVTGGQEKNTQTPTHLIVSLVSGLQGGLRWASCLERGDSGLTQLGCSSGGGFNPGRAQWGDTHASRGLKWWLGTHRSCHPIFVLDGIFQLQKKPQKKTVNFLIKDSNPRLVGKRRRTSTKRALLAKWAEIIISPSPNCDNSKFVFLLTASQIWASVSWLKESPTF